MEKQTLFGFHPKRKTLNRINRLISFLYIYGIKLGFDKRFSAKDKFAMLKFDKQLREITEELITEWNRGENEKCSNCIHCDLDDNRINNKNFCALSENDIEDIEQEHCKDWE